MGRRISVLMAVDEPYAGPLCVTVASLLEHLRAGVGLDLYLMQGGVAPATRRRIENAWDERVRVRWVPLDDAKRRALHGRGSGSSPVANHRLLVGSSLPVGVSKVLYLDADILVRKDVFEIWMQDMGGKIVLAVQDGYIQRFPPGVLPAGEQARQGQPAARPYFNSGVMVIDLAAWRAAGIEGQCLEAARRLQHRTKWLDQQVLNVCLVGRWGALPPIWNRQFALTLFPDWRCSPYGEHEFEAALRAPAIIHFSSCTKPWHPFSDHPEPDVLAYRAALQRTPFGEAIGFRPSRWNRFVERLAAPHRRLLDRIAAVVRTKRRTHALRAMLPAMVRLAVCHPWTLVTVPLSVVGERVAMGLQNVGPRDDGDVVGSARTP